MSNIELLLNYCDRFYDRQFLTRGKASKDIVQRFEQLLNDYFARENLVNVGLPDVKFFCLAPEFIAQLLCPIC